MTITRTIEINKSAADVWRLLADDFDKVYEWMSPVYHSYAIKNEEPIEGALMAGRICEFTPEVGGFHAEERITSIDSEKRQLTIEVIPINAPKALPIVKNTLELTVQDTTTDKSVVVWTTHPELKTAANLVKPLIKAGLGKVFGDLLGELKHFVETGEQHPRKSKKVTQAAA